MKIAHCAIDTSLNFTQANKLIKDLKPTTLVVPETYTKPPVSAPNLTELVIHNTPDVNLIPYKWGEVRPEQSNKISSNFVIIADYKFAC